MIIYFAGGESMYPTLKRAGVKNVLVSYYYLRNKGHRTVEKILRYFPNVFLDSGAYTLQQHMIKMGISSQQMSNSMEMDAYIDEYVDFIHQYGEGFKIVAEIDVGTWQQKTRYREMLEERIPRGIRLLPVIHRSDPDMYLEYLCSNYAYIGMGGLRTGRSLAEMRKYVAKRLLIPRKHGTLIHGFAITIVDVMRAFGMASADSATWLHGGKHGMTFWFDGRHLRSYDKFQKWVRVRFKNEVKSVGVDWDAFMDDKPSAVNAYNLSQWLQFQEYLTTEGSGLGKFKASQERFFQDKAEILAELERSGAHGRKEIEIEEDNNGSEDR